MADAELAGLVLAGGRSTRFGADKALVEVDGATLLTRAVVALRAVCDGRVLVASGDGSLGRPRVAIADGEVADLPGATGPLAGIGAGLAALRDDAPAVAVLAVDVLHPSPAMLDLLAEMREDAACCVPVVDGWRQPLHAVWATAVADEVATAVAGGVAGPLPFLAGRDDVVEVGEVVLRARGADPADASRDVDTPDDLPG